MPPALLPSDEEYESAEDSDFAPDAVTAQVSEADSDSEAEKPVVVTKGKGAAKRKRGDEEVEDAGFENSGDEAIIERGLKRQKKRGKGKQAEDDEGGEGGFVKTRTMRAQEKTERKPLADTSAATVDVDALWASMLTGTSANAASPNAPNNPTVLTPSKNGKPASEVRQKSGESGLAGKQDEPMIMIKRSYNFAGKVHTEQKLVPRHSAEAKLYLASQSANSSTAEEAPSLFAKPKRPTKKARRSIFEPVAVDLPLRNDLSFGPRAEGVGVLGAGATKDAKKLNTVEKSAMDWAGFVDKEGIADELDAAGKKKGAYKERQQFLARVEQKKEEEARRARGIVD